MCTRLLWVVGAAAAAVVPNPAAVEVGPQDWGTLGKVTTQQRSVVYYYGEARPGAARVCLRCKELDEVWDEVAVLVAEYDLKAFRLNCTKHESWCDSKKVGALPAFRAFQRYGALADTFTGIVHRVELLYWVDRVFNTRIASALPYTTQFTFHQKEFRNYVASSTGTSSTVVYGILVFGVVLPPAGLIAYCLIMLLLCIFDTRRPRHQERNKGE